MPDKSREAFINVFLFSLFWALQIFVSKMGLNAGAEAIALAFQSAFVALIFLAIVVLPKIYREVTSLSRDVFWGLMIANAFHFGLGSFFSYSGYALTSAINAGFLVKFALVATIFLAWGILKEKMTATKIVSAAVMIVGSYLITTNGRSLVPQIGDLLILFACLSWSLGNVLIRKTIKDNNVSGDTVSFLKPIAGIPVFFLFILLSPLYPGQVGSAFSVNYFDFSFYPYILASGVFSALLWIYLNRTLKVATASYMTMMSMMTPIFVTVLAIFVLGEPLTIVQTVGGLLIISAGIITHYSDISRK